MKYKPSPNFPDTTVQTIAIFGGVDQFGIPDVTSNSRFIQWQIKAIHFGKGETIYIGNHIWENSYQDYDPNEPGI